MLADAGFDSEGESCYPHDEMSPLTSRASAMFERERRYVAKAIVRSNPADSASHEQIDSAAQKAADGVQMNSQVRLPTGTDWRRINWPELPERGCPRE